MHVNVTLFLRSVELTKREDDRAILEKMVAMGLPGALRTAKPQIEIDLIRFDVYFPNSIYTRIQITYDVDKSTL